MTEPRDDPLVRTALRHLPVPDHGPEFWERLEASLAPAPEAAPEPAPDPEPEPEPEPTPTLVPVPSVVPAGMRRASTVLLAGVATVAVVLVVVAAATLIGRDPDGVDTGGTAAADLDADADADPDADADGAPPTQALTGTTAVPADGSPVGEDGWATAPLSAVDDPSSPDEVAAAFVVAVDAGDAARAWSLLAPASQAHWGDEAGFAASLGELAEGAYGSFRAARGLTVTTLALDSSALGEDAGVVTLDGVVDLEGDERRRTLDLPYLGQPDGTWLLEPWGRDQKGGDPDEGDPAVRFTAPAPVRSGFAVLDATDAVEAEIPAWATTVLVAVDGTELDDIEREPGSSTVVVRPADPFAPGLHRLTVAASGPEGVVATSVVVRVP